MIFRSICSVPPEVKEDYITKEWERERVDRREVLVAFKLDEKKNLTKEKEGTAHIGVFSFLPLKEIPSGLNFLIQADFLTTPGRGELARKCLWNDWLADEILKLIIEKCIPTFLNHDEWKFNFTTILYSSTGGHELFEERIKEPLNDYLENNPVLIAEDGSLSKPEELISVTERMRELLNEEDLKLLYPNKKIIHRKCVPHPNLKIKKTPEDIYEFITSSKSEEFLKQKARKRDVRWFKKLYSMLVERYTREYFRGHYYQYRVEHDNFWNGMRDLHVPIILTNDYNLAKINECYTNSKNISIPDRLKDKFKIVHPQIAKDKGFKKFLRKLNSDRCHLYNRPDTKVIRDLTEEDIKNALKQQEILKLDKEKWESLSDRDKMEKIKEIKKLWDGYSISVEDYKFITLKSKNGKWIRPEKLVFPQEYAPDHNIENLLKKGLIDIPIEFVSPEFIRDCDNDDEIRKWRKFFEELGVDKILDTEKRGGKKEKIVQRIGVLSALKYEEKSGRKARELGESGKLGCDIVSESENDKRYIEVKSRSDTSPDIFLTVNEFKALRDKKEKYFIYIILDALRSPMVYIIQGDKLLEIEDMKIIIPFNKWREISNEEFKP